jgi:hypothetical protein
VISDQQIKRALKFAAPILSSQFDTSKATEILQKMEENYTVLAPDVPQFRSSFNRMTIKIAVDVVAFYRAVRTELPKPRARELVQPFVNNWMDGQFDRWIARKVYANRTLHRFYRRWWFADINRADEPDGQKFEYLPPDGDLFYGVNVTRCGMVKYLTRMGVPELAPMICRGDYHIGKYLPKGIEFRRTQVIAEGGTCCDFRYYVK